MNQLQQSNEYWKENFNFLPFSSAYRQTQNQEDGQINMTYLKKAENRDALIHDAIDSLPLDLSLGIYHFRFKIQFNENEERSVNWIDISNLLAKAPIINKCIYIKILILSHNKFNKLFSTERLEKAKSILNSPKEVNMQSKPIQIIQEKRDMINLIPVKSPQKSEVEKNLQTMRQTTRIEEEDREQEILAKKHLEQKIMKWGYTDGKKVNNTPTLLATLHEVWPEWPPVSLTQMLQPQQVTAFFKKAVIKVHPDKNRNEPHDKKYLSKKVFELLNQSRYV